VEVYIGDNCQNKPEIWETPAFTPPADQENLECQTVNLGEFVRDSSGWSYLSIFQPNEELNIRSLLLSYGVNFYVWEDGGLWATLGEDETP
jgi:hypothetical protein